jgi:hypothetical protein
LPLAFIMTGGHESTGESPASAASARVAKATAKPLRRSPCRATVCGNRIRLEIAAAGGADRSSAKIADAPMNQSREAQLSARPLHSPEGGPLGGHTAKHQELDIVGLDAGEPFLE